MASDESRSVAIIVAVIGLAGVLGAALISNWDKLFPKGSSQNDQNQAQKVVSGIPKGTKVVKQGPTSAVTSEDQDSVEVLAIMPPTNDGLTSTAPFAVSMRLRYRLVSADSVLLVPFLEQYTPGDQCASKYHITIATNDPSQIPIKRGEGEVSVVFKVEPGKKEKSSDFGNEGYVAPNASFWAGFDGQGRVIMLKDMLWDSTKYCYHLAPRVAPGKDAKGAGSASACSPTFPQTGEMPGRRVLYFNADESARGAEVYLDGRCQGYLASQSSGNLRDNMLVNVPPGSYEIALRKKGYQDFRSTIIVPASETPASVTPKVVVKVKLIPS